MQNRHGWAVDICIVSLGAAIRALREHALSGLEDLVGPALHMVDDTSEDEAPPCKRRRTRSDEESGEDRSLSDDEPDNDIPDAALAHDGGSGAPESGDDEPCDPFEEAELQRARDARRRPQPPHCLGVPSAGTLTLTLTITLTPSAW